MHVKTPPNETLSLFPSDVALLRKKYIGRVWNLHFTRVLDIVWLGWEKNVSFPKKNIDLHTRKAIVTLKYIINRPKKHLLFCGFFYTMYYLSEFYID